MNSIEDDILKQSITSITSIQAPGNWTVSGTNGISGRQIQNVWVDEYSDTIKGEMITVSHTLSDLEASLDTTPVNEFRNKIKSILLEKLIEELKKSNTIEFTSTNDPKNHQTVFKARIFATPDSQVRILRKAGK